MVTSKVTTYLFEKTRNHDNLLNKWNAFEGQAITKELLQLGCSVRIASRDEDRLRLAAEKMSERFNNISYMR